MLNTNIKSVAAKYNRCLSFVLASGETVEVKVLGEKADAAASAKKLLTALVSGTSGE